VAVAVLLTGAEREFAVGYTSLTPASAATCSEHTAEYIHAAM